MTRLLLLALFLSPQLLGQEEREGRKKIAIEPSWKPPVFEPAPEIDDRRAAQAAAAFKESYGEDDRDARIAAVDVLEHAGRHESFLPLLKKALGDREPEVRARAAVALGRLGDRRALSALSAAWNSPANKDAPEVRVQALASLGMLSEGKSYHRKYRKVFEGEDAVEMRAVALLFGHTKDKAALEVLANWVEPEEPANPGSPSNPPAAYWEKKHRLWRGVRNEVLWAVWNITGTYLDTKKGVLDWIEEERKKSKSRKRRGGRGER